VLKKRGLLRSKGGPRIEKGGPEEVPGSKKGVPRRSAGSERHRRTWAGGKNDGEVGQRDSAEGGSEQRGAVWTGINMHETLLPKGGGYATFCITRRKGRIFPES
jgi:hypothetical protein